ncbi:MAG: methyltransferase domain-containing protein, partial [Rhodospirillaceae bacterium]|nr:methyltransferase domain-containing protein [Rhodospirillaceae bacterium]
DIYALEPNANARSILVRDEVVPDARVINGSAECISLADASVDLVFTSGVLVLVEPTRLEAACREMHRVSRKYILTIEYFANEPEEKTYRGETGLLFKRDLGVFCLDLFPTLSVIDYGFFWKPITGLDNLTWWLFAKS